MSILGPCVWELESVIKELFGYFYLRFWLVSVLVLAIPHLNVVEAVVLNYCREGLDATMNKLLDSDYGDWAQFLGMAWISIITKTTPILVWKLVL